MEDIKRAIEENKFWRTFIKENRCWTPIADAIGKLAYNNGYNKAKKEFEESTRWRKVEEELPEDNKTVLLEIEYDGVIDYSAGHFYDKGKKSHIDCELYEDAIITHWKPIH